MNKNNLGWRSFVVLLVIGIALWSIWPTLQVHSLSGEAKTTFIKENPKIFKGAINFGLDLAGGTHVVVEIDTTGMKVRDGESRSEALSSAQDQSLEILRNRVDQFGLSEPLITKSGKTRIVADLAGVDATQARGLIGETAQLEFKLVITKDEFLPVLNRIDAYLSQKAETLQTEEITPTVAPVTTTQEAPFASKPLLESVEEEPSPAPAEGAESVVETASADTTVKGDTSVTAEIEPPQETLAQFRQRPFGGRFISFQGDLAIAEEDVEAIRKALADAGVQSLIPANIQFAMGRGWEVLDNGNRVKKFYALKRRAEMDGTEIVEAQPYRVSDGMNVGEVAVNLKFDGLGAKKFATVTGNNIKRQLAIVLDDQVVSAPVIQTRIPNGNAQITGLDGFSEAKQLAVVLRAGALPLPMKIAELRSVGATLGEENISSGMTGALVGVLLVAFFMIAYYRAAGIWTVIALVLNVLLIIAIMSTFHATLTLPGIAGIVLTIGMAVDANVLIFERIREELRLGRTVRAAVQAGYEKAFSAIIDSNITSILTAFVLYKVGTGPIKGFGLTLIIGLSASLFTALYVTRTIFMLVGTAQSEGTEMSIGKGILNNPKVPFVKQGPKFLAISVALIVISLGSIAIKGFNFGIDFTGGNVLTVEFSEEVSTQDVAKVIDDNTSLGIPTVRTVDAAGGLPTYLISVMQDEDDAGVRASVEKVLDEAGYKATVINEELVGPAIGKQLKINTFWAIFWSIIIMTVYIWFRFGKFGLGFGLGVMFGLIHDIVIILGFFSLTDVSFDSTMIAALLTIAGYSINDTIVIYDRIRENTQLIGKETFASKVDLSINQSLGRSIWTGFSTLLVTLSLALLGGVAIHDFAVAMSLGVVIGFWSSCFIASPFLIWWTNRFGLKN